MAYADFTLDTLDDSLGITSQMLNLFPDVAAVPVPTWLQDTLRRGFQQPLVSEKSRSEFVVAPVLLATQELCPTTVAIYSGQRLDVDPSSGLMGECDFILTATDPLPTLRSPILTVVEAKKQDIESGIAQCLAQMAGARLFNERMNKNYPQMFGCVTTGENWQFLRLEGKVAGIDRTRYYINNVGQILGILLEIVSRSPTVV